MTYLLPPLNALRAFEAAARHLSFKLAAHELHVTAGAVSQLVKGLEQRLGRRLFERLHRQLILTAAVAAQLPPCRAGCPACACPDPPRTPLPAGRVPTAPLDRRPA